MFRGQPVVALIPARGGSKGLPGKNLMSIGGKSLIERAAESALGSGLVDFVVVSSDDEQILALAETIPRVMAHRRPDALATDTATAVDVVEDMLAISELELNGKNPWVLYLQPTSPARNSSHVKHAFELLEGEPEAKAVISVNEPEKSPYWSFVIGENGKLEALFPEATTKMRQQLPKVFMPNGAIYLFTRDRFVEANSIPSVGALPLTMTISESVDIDTIEDFEKAKAIILKQEQ